MKLGAIPNTRFTLALAISAVVALVLLLAGLAVTTVSWLVAAWLALYVMVAVSDLVLTRKAWRAAEVRMQRVLPAAFALGVSHDVELQFEVASTHVWHCRLFDHADASLLICGLPAVLDLVGGKRTSTTYNVRPTARGPVRFEPADLFVRSRWRCWELRLRVGEQEMRRVYPDFAQISRFAWLAGDRRLAEIGIKTYQQRGEGTDFKQLAEYRIGDSIRHIDWKATSRFGKPIVRQFQNERDQCVMFLIDCGRRMRSDDRTRDIGQSHFDQVLNAVMLLTYVALGVQSFIAARKARIGR